MYSVGGGGQGRKGFEIRLVPNYVYLLVACYLTVPYHTTNSTIQVQYLK